MGSKPSTGTCKSNNEQTIPFLSHNLKTMKKVILLPLLFTVSARAQWTVFDPSVFAQVVEQLSTARTQLVEVQNEVHRLGDPGAIQQLVGLSPILAGVGRAGLGKSIDTLEQSFSPNLSFWDDANKVYRAIGDRVVLPDGAEVLRRVDDYKKYALLLSALTDLKTVHEDTEKRRQTVLVELERTAERIKQAPTMAEVAKLQAVEQAQQAVLGSVDRERDAAFQRLQALALANHSDDQRQERARQEERAAGFFHATTGLSQFLEINPGPVVLPNPARP